MSAVKQVNFDAKTLHNYNKKLQSEFEFEAMIDRYDKECGECITFKSIKECEEWHRLHDKKEGKDDAV